jgi:hypothetical protein
MVLTMTGTVLTMNRNAAHDGAGIRNRGAQFLPAVAIGGLNLPVHSESRALASKRLRVQRVTVLAHSGQSSQLP